MNWAFIADIIVSVHFGYVIFVVGALFVIILGGVLHWSFIRNIWFRAIHMVMILAVVFEAFFGISCPLTEWEYKLRIAAGQQNVINKSFVARLIHFLIFYDFPQIVFTIGYCLFGITVIISWWLFPPLLIRKQKE
jgi:hypothetical protein